MSPCYDPREGMGHDAQAAHHKSVETLLEEIMLLPLVPEEYRLRYEAICKRYAEDHDLILNGTYWDVRGRP